MCLFNLITLLRIRRHNITVLDQCIYSIQSRKIYKLFLTFNIMYLDVYVLHIFFIVITHKEPTQDSDFTQLAEYLSV